MLWTRLFPRPRTVRPSDGAWDAPSVVTLAEGGGAGSADAARALLESALAVRGSRIERRAETSGSFGDAVFLEAGDAEGGAGDAYRLEVTPRGARIRGAGAAGLFYGAATLAQALRQSDSGPLPCVEIEDAPAFAERGIMLDVSRSRVPTMETLELLVERFAGWKLNRLQLYTEHTFAYADHEGVWHGQSPLRSDEIRRLAGFCRERFIELVPNQQSFGHLHHWLRHERYRDLAECPAGVEHPFHWEREPFSLCPSDPRSLAFLGELYDELLPCFAEAGAGPAGSSDEVNVGCDETFDVGLGRSAEACKKEGVGRVYVGFLRGIHRLLAERGKRMQFWADVLLRHPELSGDEIPGDAVPVIWGYEADHPFDEQCARVAASGHAHLVAPGTSSWQSLGGRTENMRANVAAAARAAAAHGARGLLVTDWGDHGHLQPLPASVPGWAAGASAGWAGERRPERDELAAAVDRDFYGVPGTPAAPGSLGRASLRLGDAAAACGVELANASPLSLLLTKVAEPFPPPQLAGLGPAGLERALAVVDEALAEVPAPEGDGHADLAARELVLAGGLLRFAARLGLARLHRPDLASLRPEDRAGLAFEVEGLVDEHRLLWARRCRPGGLEASTAWLERVSARLRPD